jgi:hypothetical protein
VTPGTRRYRVAIRHWIEASDFNGHGCRHTQTTIAQAVGCDKRTVIRELSEWEAEGGVQVQRGPKGSKTCNVYRVRDRCPQLREPVLRRLSQLRRNRSRGICHSKGTAPSRALHAAGSPPSRPQLKTNNGFVPNREPATWPKSRTSRRRALCHRCDQLVEENGGLVDQVSGLLYTTGKQGREIGRLKREAEKWQVGTDGKPSKEADLVRRCLAYWLQKLEKLDPEKAARVKITLIGARAGAVRQGIRWGWDTPPELKAVVDGLFLAPYVVFGSRRSSGAPSSRRIDLTHAFKDEASIEELIAIAAPHIRVGEQVSMNGDGP